MLNARDIYETLDMIDRQHLDIRTITMGISLRDCADRNPERCGERIYEKIVRQAEHLVRLSLIHIFIFWPIIFWLFIL